MGILETGTRDEYHHNVTRMVGRDETGAHNAHGIANITPHHLGNEHRTTETRTQTLTAKADSDHPRGNETTLDPAHGAETIIESMIAMPRGTITNRTGIVSLPRRAQKRPLGILVFPQDPVII